MRCDETLSLHNCIFNSPYVIKRHPVVFKWGHWKL